MATLKIWTLDSNNNGYWAIVEDISGVKYIEQELTEAQKAQARKNIGAASSTEEFIEIESPDVFIFDYTTKTWNIDPTGPFILTKSFNGTQLPGGDSFMHSCTYYKGDIVRHEIVGSPDMAVNDGAPYHIKQTIQHATMSMEHYRYWRTGSGWTGWNYTVHGPKPRLNGSCPSNIVSLGINYDDPMGGFVELVYTAADTVVTNYGNNHYVSYDKETTLTDAQKVQARDNIGAPAIGNNILDGALLIYNAQTKQIIDSGFTIKTFYDKILADIKTWIATTETIEDNEAGGQTAMYSAPPESVASVANEQGGDTLMIGGIE